MYRWVLIYNYYITGGVVICMYPCLVLAIICVICNWLDYIGCGAWLCGHWKVMDNFMLPFKSNLITDYLLILCPCTVHYACVKLLLASCWETARTCYIHLQACNWVQNLYSLWMWKKLFETVDQYCAIIDYLFYQDHSIPILLQRATHFLMCVAGAITIWLPSCALYSSNTFSRSGESV